MRRSRSRGWLRSRNSIVASQPGASKKQTLVTALDTVAKFGEQIGNTMIFFNLWVVLWM
jgi:hypothetical protein